jgi:phosphate transport system substrate-binding protein
MRNLFFVMTLVLTLAASPASAQAPVLRVEGTTNLAPLLTKEATSYEAAHPGGTQIHVAGTSSGAGIAALRDGSIDVAASDIAVNDPGFVDTSLGTVGFAFVANPEAGVKNLTRAQAIGIFAGKITNWKTVGGNDCPIVIVSRDIGTGTRLVLEEKVAKTLIQTRVAVNADAVMADITSTRGALGYIASYFVRMHGDLVLAYNGVMPTEANIKDHTYAFSTVEHLYLRNNASAEAKSFVSTVANDAALLKWYGIY